MNCCVCKAKPKQPGGYQMCGDCLRKFAKHVNEPEPQPFLVRQQVPQPTPTIKGDIDSDGQGVKVPEIAAAAPLPKQAAAS